MSNALAAYRTVILQLLDDASAARFTNLQIDQALRWALAEYSRSRPPVCSYNVDGTGEYRIAMPNDFQPVHVLSAEFHDEDANPQLPVTIYAYQTDGEWTIETRDRLIAVGESLDVTYTAALHTIDDLDSAAGTTVPDADETILQVGAAGYAAQTRAMSQVDSINLQPDVSKKLLEVAQSFLKRFWATLTPATGSAFAQMPPLQTDVF